MAVMAIDYARRQAMYARRETERHVTNLRNAIEEYVEATDWDGEWFLDQYVASLLEGFRGLLNGDIGSLDAGKLDSWACDMLKQVHYDADTGERINSNS